MSELELADIHGSAGAHSIPVDAVGISHLRHPICVLDRAQAKQQTVASITMSVDLPADRRGAHLSRFLDVLAEANDELTIRTAPALLATLRARFACTTARIDAEFPYFLPKRAPVTGASGLLDVTCRLSFRSGHDERHYATSVVVPVTTLCPCSKAVSDYGAHNQRCRVTIEVSGALKEHVSEDNVIWIEDLVALAEASASAPVYPALKRPDERFVTMQAYENPAFVEDVVRDVAASLRDDRRVEAFLVDASSEESIHNHRAYARIGRPHGGWGGW